MFLLHVQLAFLLHEAETVHFILMFQSEELIWSFFLLEALVALVALVVQLLVEFPFDLVEEAERVLEHVAGVEPQVGDVGTESDDDAAVVK